MAVQKVEPKKDARTRIQSYTKRLETLRTDRGNYLGLWGELSEYHLGQRGRYLAQNPQRNVVKRNTAQYNNSSKMAARTLGAGMMTGITSPARPWFKLGSGNPELDEFRTVKEWLFQVEKLMYRIFNASNFYNMMHQLYMQIGVYGTSAMGIFQDYNNVIRCQTYPMGSYMLGLSGTDTVDTIYREYSRSVGQLVKEFGFENCSNSVQTAWNNGDTENMIPMIHVVEPNDDRDHMSPMNFDMPYRSVYFERGENTKFLRESGFKDFPIMAPRWEVDGEDVYGSDCPGITALGDTKGLQLGEKRMYQALDKVGNPPLQGSANVAGKTGGNTPAPGSVIILGPNDKGLESIYKGYSPDLNAIVAINQGVESRISRAFFEDLFLMLINTNRDMTATEVVERHEEKLIVLGPVLERLHSELLDPAISRTFNIAVEAGIVPPPPAELQGRELVVEYVSILAQAQRMLAIGGIERTAAFAIQLASIWPEARHKINVNNAIDEYSHAMGISPMMIRTDDEAAELSGAEAQQINQQNALNNADLVADTQQKRASSAEALVNAGLV